MAQKKITDLTLRSSFDETCNLPADDTSQTWRVTGQQIKDYIAAQKTQSYGLDNLTLTTAVGSSALTIAVKTKAGSNASSADPINVGMRSATLISGSYNLRQITGALSLVISSGSTLGQVSAQPSRIYVYLIDNAGTLELAASHALFSEDNVVSTTAEGGAGAADSATVMYSNSARSNVACRLIGYIDNTQTTAGTWASAGTVLQLLPTQAWKAPTIQKFTSSSGTYYTPAGAKYIRVRAVGGGGGGAGSGANGSAYSSGSTGGDTTFGPITASGGVGGTAGAGLTGGAGGAASLGSGPIGTAIAGSSGGGGQASQTSTNNLNGGHGGCSPFGGAGGSSGNQANGTAAIANSGSGGGGGGMDNAGGLQFTGGGGGSGGFVDCLITALAASYSYGVGALGGKGSAGTNGHTGGDGGSGYIEVTEYYQ